MKYSSTDTAFSDGLNAQILVKLAQEHPVPAFEPTGAIPVYNSPSESAPILLQPQQNSRSAAQLKIVDPYEIHETGPVKLAAHMLKDASRENDSKAVALLELVEKSKDPEHALASAYWLAFVHQYGRGVVKNETKALVYYRQLLKQLSENADVLYAVGRANLHGLFGQQQNTQAALRQLTQAGQKGVAAAYWEIGMAHMNGMFGEPDAFLARNYVEKAAHDGAVSGMISAAVMNALGQGGPVNRPRAFYWYELAARSGSAHAIRGLGAMLLNGNGIPKDAASGIALLRLARDAGDLNAVEILDLVKDDHRPIGFEGAVAVKRAFWLERLQLVPAARSAL